MQKKLSFIILGTIFISFALLLIISTVSLRHFGMKNAEEKAEVIAELIQDGLTAHMLSGTMDQRDFFLKKIATSKGVESLWIARGQNVIDQFGKGRNNEIVRDAIDEQVLKNGRIYKNTEETSQHVKLRVTAPYIAKENGNPNCLKCHAAQEGHVLGVVSMVFDLEELRNNGIWTSSIILGFSILIMILVFFIINRSMKPLMGLFDSINFVMKKAQEGDYRRRVRPFGSSPDCQNVRFWINSFFDKLELTLVDIEGSIKKFLSLKSQTDQDLLLEVKNIVHELSDIYQFKRTIEFDEDKEHVYDRIGMILKDVIHLKDFTLVETGKHAIHPTIVFDASTVQRPIDPRCRAMRTKQMVNSNTFTNICGSCSDVCEHYLCIPYLISDDLELLLTMSASSQDEIDKIHEKLPLIQNYIDAARPELVSKNLTEILKISSTTDALTGLYNRKYLDEYIDKALSQAKRNETTYGILMIDIDFFKMVNDTYGHDVGDKALKMLSKILKDNIREADTAFRFGGEEFLVLLYQCEEHMVKTIANKIRLAFEKSPIQSNTNASFYKTLSVGASMFSKDSDSMWKCIKFADIALYAAKDSGRNCVKLFEPAMIENKEMKSDF
ncbi:MAG: GGDEF domain-containing protein [Sulfurospirillaceae bacterium]|nr:GGDEF domain-containing protein [Sulfurospirillaceae bacterium]MDD2826467.1 GGDEF domain-containing protein [Sulfurospirillaceae bacterium]